MSYNTREDIEDVFGIENVTKWADLDNDADATKIADRIARSITYAAGKIDAYMRYTFYVVPLEPIGSELDPVIVDIASIYCGVWLYENRGIADYNPQTGAQQNRLAYNLDRANKSLASIRYGPLRLNLVQDDHVGPLG